MENKPKIITLCQDKVGNINSNYPIMQDIKVSFSSMRLKQISTGIQTVLAEPY